MREEAAVFGRTDSLVGIVTQPTAKQSGPAEIGVILLNAGILHRVGPGRIYVKLARELALLGFASLRFDFSGIGDSKPRRDNLPFDKSSIDETQSAMAFLQNKCGANSFILLGGCSGARVSFATAACDHRVAACILINFQVTPDDERDADPASKGRKDEHYYMKFAVRNPRSWLRLFTGQADYHKLSGAIVSALRHRIGRRKRNADPPQWISFRSELRRLINRGVKLIFVCSEGDTALEELREAGRREFAELCSQKKMEIVVVPRSDHTFSSMVDQEHLIRIIRQKISEIAPLATSEDAPPNMAGSRVELPHSGKVAHVQ